MKHEVLADIPEGRFYNVTDLINDYIATGKKVGIYPVSEKSWIDVGQLEELQSALHKFGTK
jgi:dTDP-glucose pyrophosphorylase